MTSPSFAITIIEYLLSGRIRLFEYSRSEITPKIGFQDRLSAILSTFNMLPFSIKTFVLFNLSGRLRLVSLDFFTLLLVIS